MNDPNVPEGDAFGAALLAQLDALDSGGTLPEIVERDDGFIDAKGHLRGYFSTHAEWGRLDHEAIDRIKGRVLDVGAGAGRVSLELAARGFDVLALDPSPGAIEVCRRRGVASTFLGTVSELRARGTTPFDRVVMLGNNLALLGSVDHARKLLADLHAITAPGARILGSCLDPYRTTIEEHLTYHAHNRACGRLGGQVRIRVRHRRLATPWFEYSFLSIEELTKLLDGSGWSLEHVEHEGPFYLAVLDRA